MTVRLEHANLILRNIDATLRFLQTAFPEFLVRYDSRGSSDARWMHVGTEDSYSAMTQSQVEPEQHWMPYMGIPGVNHLDYEVDDVEAWRLRLKSAGYTESTVPNTDRHRRCIYFYDPDGNDWEFVQYLTLDPAKRNEYLSE